MCAYSEASFASNRDLSSQIGFMVLLTDDSHRCHILVHWSSKKCARVTRSILGIKLYAFSDALDFASALKLTIDNIIGMKIPLFLLKSSKSFR